MKSFFKPLIILSIILALFVPGATIKVQARIDNAPECVLKAVRDFRVVVGFGATLEVKRDEEFVGKLHHNIARIEIKGVWYEVSRNNVMLVTSECVLKAVRDFRVVVGRRDTREVKRGEEFVGKLHPNVATVKINGVWYQVSRNEVMLVSSNVPEKNR